MSSRLHPLEAPAPPQEPGPFDCCGNGCGDACVWPLYRLEKARYQQALSTDLSSQRHDG